MTSIIKNVQVNLFNYKKKLFHKNLDFFCIFSKHLFIHNPLLSNTSIKIAQKSSLPSIWTGGAETCPTQKQKIINDDSTTAPSLPLSTQLKNLTSPLEKLQPKKKSHMCEHSHLLAQSSISTGQPPPPSIKAGGGGKIGFQFPSPLLINNFEDFPRTCSKDRRKDHSS